MSVDPALDSSEQIAAIEQREAWYRAKTLREFLELKKALKLRELEVDERRQDLEARDTTIHRLHAEIDLLKVQLANRATYLEQFARRLAAAEEERDQRAAQIARMRCTWGWALSAPIRSLQKRFFPASLAATSASASVPATNFSPGLEFVYHLPTTPFRIYPHTAVTLQGWAFPRDRRRISGLRARIDTTIFPGEYGLPEAAVAAHHGFAPGDDALGFVVDVIVPTGRHTLGLEAELGADGWFTIVTLPVWGDPEL